MGLSIDDRHDRHLAHIGAWQQDRADKGRVFTPPVVVPPTPLQHASTQLNAAARHLARFERDMELLRADARDQLEPEKAEWYAEAWRLARVTRQTIIDRLLVDVQAAADAFRNAGEDA